MHVPLEVALPIHAWTSTSSVAVPLAVMIGARKGWIGQARPDLSAVVSGHRFDVTNDLPRLRFTSFRHLLQDLAPACVS